MVALRIPRVHFYVQYMTDDGEWRFHLDDCQDFAVFHFYPTAEEQQIAVAYAHPGCSTRIVDQLGNVYGIPLTVVEG